MPLMILTPLQICCYTWLLYHYFGPNFLIGIVALIIIIISSTLLQRNRMKYQNRILKLKDKRMRTTSQLFDMIKAIKYNSWEKYFLNKLLYEREEELKILRKVEEFDLYIKGFFWSSGSIMAVISIIFHNIFNHQMGISNILTSIHILLIFTGY